MKESSQKTIHKHWHYIDFLCIKLLFNIIFLIFSHPLIINGVLKLLFMVLVTEPRSHIFR